MMALGQAAAAGPEPQAHVLIIEDEAPLATVLADNLHDEGMLVTLAPDGREGARLWRSLAPDLIVLDVMLPKQDGFSLCRDMRNDAFDTPVLFLSARGAAEDRVRGLEVGGDDYLPKPFHLTEFLLRVKALMRRRAWSEPANSTAFRFAGHVVDYRSWTATLANGRKEMLAERELRIFRALADRPGEVVSRDDILDAAWGDDAFPSSRTIDNFVMRLRRLFEPDPSRPRYIHTVWGVGYRLTTDSEPEDAQDSFRHGRP